jgi:hypothetical protein
MHKATTLSDIYEIAQDRLAVQTLEELIIFFGKLVMKYCHFSVP